MIGMLFYLKLDIIIVLVYLIVFIFILFLKKKLQYAVKPATRTLSSLNYQALCI